MEHFTALYPLQKTLRMKLLPTDTTATILQQTNIVLNDKNRYESYQIIKQALDEVHMAFLADSINSLDIGNDELENYIRVAADKSSRKKDIEAAAKPILACFSTSFAKTNEEWRVKYKLKKSFTSTPETQLAVLKSRHQEIAKKIGMEPTKLAEMLAQFDKFSAYFAAYHLNRLNVYAPELKATSAANRTLQNLVKFAKNRDKYLSKYASGSLLPPSCVRLFDITNYNLFISQQGIDEYKYQIGKLNDAINKLRQTLKIKKERSTFPLFEELYKQILTKPEKLLSFDQIKTKNDFVMLMQQLQDTLPDDLQTLQEHFAAYVSRPNDVEHIYLSSRAVNTLLYTHTKEPGIIRNFLPEQFTTRKTNQQEGSVVAHNFLALSDLFAAIDAAQNESETSILDSDKVEVPHLVVWEQYCNDIQKGINEARSAVDAFARLSTFDQQQKEVIKKALDAYNDIYRMYTYFELRYKNEPIANLDENDAFYQIFKQSDGIFPVDKAERFSHKYDLARNWLTKKPYSLEKWVLKFDCGQLLTGWDVNKEPEKHGAIIKDPDNNFYLVVLTNEGKNILDRKKNPTLFDDADGWQKMEYKLLPGPNKMLPKCFFSKKYRESTGVPEDIDTIYRNGEFKKGDTFNLGSLHKLIDFYKGAIETYPGWGMYKFNFQPTSEYESIDQFYFDVELGGYRLDYTSINHSILDRAESQGQLYIFRISNKDLANLDHKKVNLHTSYFLEALNPGSNIKLNGEAEIFFRPKSIDTKEIKDKKTPQGSDIIKNKRFMTDQYTLHIPLTLNRKSRPVTNISYNRHAIERIKSNNVNAIIGIDRGEKHLAYIAIVDKNGKLLAQPESLNTVKPGVGNGKYDKDYYDKLVALEDQRKENRQNWEAVSKIKDLKDGYVSYCIKRVVDLMLEHNAIVALENLNIGFKQGRAKIERNTYNQFEQALLNKLQYVVRKDTAHGSPYSPQHGVQLTPPDVAPKSTGNHMGYVFYVDPSYTSKIDPVSGYRQQFRIDDRVKVPNFRQFIAGFDGIVYKDDNLLFTFNWKWLATSYNKLGKTGNKQKDSAYPDQTWTITANVRRSFYKRRTQNRKEQQIQTANCQEALLALFAAHGVSHQQDIRQQLLDKTFTSEFVKQFVSYFNLINSLRNTIDDKDAIISPVYPNGFDSTRDKLDGYDWDGDANGAYNIARKGAILLQKLGTAQAPEDFKCTVTREEYDGFVRR